MIFQDKQETNWEKFHFSKLKEFFTIIANLERKKKGKNGKFCKKSIRIDSSSLYSFVFFLLPKCLIRFHNIYSIIEYLDYFPSFSLSPFTLINVTWLFYYFEISIGFYSSFFFEIPNILTSTRETSPYYSFPIQIFCNAERNVHWQIEQETKC